MRDILKAEWLRYRLWIILFASAHLLLLAFFMRLAALGQQPVSVYRLIGTSYAFTGMLLGLHQMGTWRRPNQWLNLLHRPVAVKRIAAALLGAGTGALFAGVLLPLLVVLAWQAWGSARIVDLRHVMIPLAALLVTVAGYLAGAYGALADRRYSSCGLVLLCWIAAAQATGAALLIVQALACAWLLLMVLVAFRPDLGAPPPSPIKIIITAVPLQMGIYVLLVLLGFIAELLWIMQGSHPVNMATPPSGGFVETDRMSGRDRLLEGLKHASLPDVPLWREQVALSEAHTIERQLGGVPLPESMGNIVPSSFDDVEARIQWTFSHRRMRFEGIHEADGSPAGELGIGGAQAAFTSIATPGGALPGLSKGDATLVAGDTLYQYQSASRRIVPRLRVFAGEHLLGTTPVGGSLAVITDRALYMFDGRHLVDADTPLEARQRVGIPGSPGDLSRAELIELVDGYLVSFTFTRQAHDMLGAAPYQSIIWVTDAGRQVAVATRMLGSDFPAIYRYRNWWASPVMYAVSDAALSLFSRPGPLETYATPLVPTQVRIVAGLIMLISLLAATWLCRRRELSWVRGGVWIVVCGAVGLPAVASLVLLVPRADHVASRSSRLADA
jgi:hypothetical protein